MGSMCDAFWFCKKESEWELMTRQQREVEIFNGKIDEYPPYMNSFSWDSCLMLDDAVFMPRKNYIHILYGKEFWQSVCFVGHDKPFVTYQLCKNRISLIGIDILGDTEEQILPYPFYVFGHIVRPEMEYMFLHGLLQGECFYIKPDDNEYSIRTKRRRNSANNMISCGTKTYTPKQVLKTALRILDALPQLFSERRQRTHKRTTLRHGIPQHQNKKNIARPKTAVSQLLSR